MYKGWISYTRRSISLISENIIKKQGLKKERSCLIFLESFNPIPENNVTERSVVIKNKVRKEIIKKSLLPHARLAQKPSGIKIKDKKTASLGEIFLSLFTSKFLSDIFLCLRLKYRIKLKSPSENKSAIEI